MSKRQKQGKPLTRSTTRFQGTPLTVVDTIASGYALGTRRLLPPLQPNDRAWEDIVKEKRTMALAHQLGLTTPYLPPGVTPELADLKRRIEEQKDWDDVGDAARHAIREALADTGIAFTAPWMHLVWGRVLRKGRGIFCGRLYSPLHDWPGPMPTHEMGTVIPLDWATEYPWDKRFEGYRFEAFGLRVTSSADVERYHPRTLWQMRLHTPSSSTGTSTIAIWAYRVRVFHQDSPIIASSRWRPGWDDVSPTYSDGALGDDPSIAVHGLELYQTRPDDG